MAFARDAVALLQNDAYVSLDHLHASAVKVCGKYDGKQQQPEVEIPSLIDFRALTHREIDRVGQPLVAPIFPFLHLEAIAARV